MPRVLPQERMGPASASQKGAADRRLSRSELCFAVAAAGVLVLLIGSASIRHSVLCESGPAEETEAAAALARQALDARLLSVEQEAMENAILMDRVLDALDARYRSTERALDGLARPRPREGDVDADFAALYADAEKLAAEIDAAMDRADDDAFARGDRAPPPLDGLAGGDWGLGGRVDDWDRADRGGADAPVDDFSLERPVGAAPMDDFAAARDAAHVRVDDGAASNAEDASTRARCELLAADYGIVPAVTWGDAPLESQDEWRRLDCDLLVA